MKSTVETIRPHRVHTGGFDYRVQYAARILTRGRMGLCERQFDSCFEQYDGDMVVVALAHRAQRNPRLAAGMDRFLSPSWREKWRTYSNLSLGEIRARAAAAREAGAAHLARLVAPAPCPCCGLAHIASGSAQDMAAQAEVCRQAVAASIAAEQAAAWADPA